MADENQNNSGGAGDGANSTPAPVTLESLKEAGLPETYFGKDGTFNVKDLAAHFSDALKIKNTIEERAKAVPADGKYDFSLPKDWKAPEGLSRDGFEWSLSEGRKAAFAEIAKERGMSQSEVSAAMSRIAAADLAEKTAAVKAQTDFVTAETAKLGANATARLKTVWDFMKANVGEDGAKAIGINLTTAASVEAMEKLITLATRGKNGTAVGGSQQDQNVNGALKDVKPGAKGAGLKYLEAANAAKH